MASSSLALHSGVCGTRGALLPRIALSHALHPVVYLNFMSASLVMHTILWANGLASAASGGVMGASWMLLVLLLGRCSRLLVLMFNVHARTRQGTCTLRSFCTARIDALYAALWIRPLRSCARKRPNLLKMTTSPWSVTSRAATNASRTPATRMFMFTWVPISVTMCSLLPSWSCTPSAITFLSPLAGDVNQNISPTCSGHADTALLESRVNSIFSNCSF